MMNRLTNRRTAEAIKSNLEGLKAKGMEVNISDLRYVKLAEYENHEEDKENELSEMCKRIFESLESEEWYE